MKSAKFEQQFRKMSNTQGKDELMVILELQAQWAPTVCVCFSAMATACMEQETQGIGLINLKFWQDQTNSEEEWARVKTTHTTA